MKHHHYNKVWSYLAALVLCLTLIQPPPTMAAGTNEVTMRVGEQRTIYAPITSASVSDGNWSSNDPQKVRILSFSSFQCEVKALTATGSSFVNLNYRYRTSTSSPYQNMDVRVTVKPPLPTGVTLTPGSMTLAVGESRSLSASVTPEGADYGSYLYSSEDPSVAEVGSDGSVYGAAPGTTRVQVRTYLEGKRAYCDVTVVPAQHRVLFDANGGSVSPDSITAANGEPYGDLPVPQREGHVFAGWFTAAGGGTEVRSTDIAELSGDQTLYAHWTPKAAAPAAVMGWTAGSPSTVVLSDPDGVLDGCAAVYAASYSGERMEDLALGKRLGTTVMVDRGLAAGWKLFFLDGDGAPVCGTVTLLPGQQM